MKKKKILIGTRASKLAIIYANRAKDELSKHFGEIELVKTTQKVILVKNKIVKVGGKGLFFKKN